MGEVQRLRYIYGVCELGGFIIAFNPQGLCVLLLDDGEPALLEALRARAPQHELVYDASLEETRQRVAALLDGHVGFEWPPLAPQGSPFQLKVWRALMDTAPGVLLTYTQLAELIDQPDSARAVASACAANPLAVVVPCHRVVRKDGALAGYRWGLWRKQALLEREGALTPRPAQGELMI